jgi:putative ABC transport system permease protein
VAGDYFEALGIPLERGRLFSAQDRPETVKAMIVNEAFARQVFGDADPLGRRIKNGPPESDSPWATIVGVVGDVKLDRLDEDAQPQTYEFWLQSTEVAEGGAFRAVTYVLRSAGDPAGVVPAVRSEVARLDPEQVVRRLRPMAEVITGSLDGERLRTGLLLSFAVMALLLAGLGIAGVMGVSVSQRTHEIGLRMALGAERGHILKDVLGGGLRLVGIGVAIGLAGGLTLSHLVSGFLYGVAATDALSYAAAAGLLLLTGLVATYLPARRAARVDPMTALRQE